MGTDSEIQSSILTVKNTFLLKSGILNIVVNILTLLT